MAAEERRPKQSLQRYSFLKLLDEITAPSISLDLVIPAAKPKHDNIPAPPSNNLGNPLVDLCNPRVAVPPRRSSKRLRLLDSSLGDWNDSTPLDLTLQKSNSVKSHSRNQTRLSSAISSLSSWNTASLDCFIDEAFSMTEGQRINKTDAIVTDKNRYSSRHVLQSYSRPTSSRGSSAPSNFVVIARSNVPETVTTGPSAAQTSTEPCKGQDDVDTNEQTVHRNDVSPHHRFRLMQTIRDFNKRSGKKRKMTIEPTNTEKPESLTDFVSSGETIQDIIESFPLPYQGKEKHGIAARRSRQAQNHSLVNDLAAPALMSNSNAVKDVGPTRGIQDGDKCEDDTFDIALPIDAMLAANQTHSPPIRLSTPTQGIKPDAITTPTTPSRTYVECKTSGEKRISRVKPTTFKRTSTNMKSPKSPRTPRIRAILPQIPLMPPTAPPQYPLPQIPQQPKCCKTCPRSAFTSIKVIAEESPLTEDDLKRRRSTQSSSMSIQNRSKRQQRSSRDSSQSSSLRACVASEQSFLLDSDSDQEFEQPIPSPLKLRSKRTRRNAQVHELKKRHSTKQLSTSKSRSKRVSFQATRPLRPRTHNRKDSQTLPEPLSDTDCHDTSCLVDQCNRASRNNENLKQTLAPSGVWVLVDSDPSALHGFQAGAISPTVTFSNPWKLASSPVAKNHTRARVGGPSCGDQQTAHGYDQIFQSVAPCDAFAIYDDAKEESDLLEQICGTAATKGRKSAPVENKYPSQHNTSSFTASIENYRRATNMISRNSKSPHLQQERASEASEAYVLMNMLCPPPSPASTNDVDTSVSRSSSPVCRNMSVTSDTSRARKGSDGSLTDPNEYDCLSYYSPLLPQLNYTPKELSGPDLPAPKATVHSAVTITPLRDENKKLHMYWKKML